MKFGIVVLPGSNCDHDALHVTRDVLGAEVDVLWHKEADLRGADCVIIPGGFAHGDGNYFADDATLDELERNRQVVFRYCDAEGRVTREANPNGSARNIAGICNLARNVLGMMPHPERCAEALLGNTDGLGVFRSIAAAMAKV